MSYYFLTFYGDFINIYLHHVVHDAMFVDGNDDGEAKKFSFRGK